MRVHLDNARTYAKEKVASLGAGMASYFRHFKRGDPRSKIAAPAAADAAPADAAPAAADADAAPAAADADAAAAVDLEPMDAIRHVAEDVGELLLPHKRPHRPSARTLV